MTILTLGKRIATAGVAMVLLISATACNNDNALSGNDPSSTPSLAESGSSTPTVTVTETATPTPDQASSKASEQDHDGTCAPDDMQLVISDGEGAAGSTYYRITATNQGNSECALGGYPTVTFLDANSNPVGQPAQAGDSTGAATLHLQPGAVASAVLQITGAQNYQGCTPVDTSQVSVTLPNQTEPIVLPLETQMCQEDISIAYVREFMLPQ